jgi:hypothetical protein
MKNTNYESPHSVTSFAKEITRKKIHFHRFSKRKRMYERMSALKWWCIADIESSRPLFALYHDCLLEGVKALAGLEMTDRLMDVTGATIR